MGFGGGISFEPEEEDDHHHSTTENIRMGAMRMDKEEDEEETTMTTTHQYDALALESLKSQQNKYVPPSSKEEPTVDDDDDKEEPVGIVITGDEALLAHTKQQQQQQQIMKNQKEDEVTKPKDDTPSKPTDTQMKEEEDDEIMNRQWEEQIARRAGISSTVPPAVVVSSPTTTTNSNNHKQHDDDDPETMMKELQSSIQSTLQQLQESRRMYESKVRHFQVELNQLSSVEVEEENDVSKIGTALEYYQNLRIQLVSWMGALRHLQSNVLTPTLLALQTHYQNHNNNNNNNHHLFLSTLQQQSWVQGFLPPTTTTVTTNVIPQVDEFGRDVTSLQTKRKQIEFQEYCIALQQSRQRKCQQQQAPPPTTTSYWERIQADYEDSDGECSDMDLLERSERRSCISDAIHVGMHATIDIEYTQINHLLTLFQHWHQHYPNDYESCFATLSLAEFLSIFVQIQLCQSWDYYTTTTKKEENIIPTTLIPWWNQIDQLLYNDDDDDDDQSMKDTLLEVICRKAILPFLQSFFTFTTTTNNDYDNEQRPCGAYNPCSKRQTRALSSLLSICHQYLQKQTDDNDNHNKHNMIETLQQQLWDYLQNYLSNISVPILQSNNDDTTIQQMMKLYTQKEEMIVEENNTIVQAAFSYASIGVVIQMKKFVLNVMTHWYPLFSPQTKPKVAKWILLDMIANRILPTLSLWNNNNNDDDDDDDQHAKQILQHIWDCIAKANLHKDFLLPAAPLRASATMFGIHTP